MHGIALRPAAAPEPPGAAAVAFTLIELLVVLVIIVLAALIVPNLLDRTDDARATAHRTVGNLMQALKLYKLDNPALPDGRAGPDALVRKPTAGAIPPELAALPRKAAQRPWGHPYQYVNPG